MFFNLHKMVLSLRPTFRSTYVKMKKLGFRNPKVITQFEQQQKESKDQRNVIAQNLSKITQLRVLQNSTRMPLLETTSKVLLQRYLKIEAKPHNTSSHSFTVEAINNASPCALFCSGKSRKRVLVWLSAPGVDGFVFNPVIKTT